MDEYYNLNKYLKKQNDVIHQCVTILLDIVMYSIAITADTKAVAILYLVDWEI